MQIERNQAKKKTFYLASFIYNSIFSITTARISAIAWGWWGRKWCKGGITERNVETWERDVIFIILTVVMISNVYKSLKTYQVVCFLNCSLLYLNYTSIKMYVKNLIKLYTLNISSL